MRSRGRPERSFPLRPTGTFLSGLLLGAGLVYLLDPDQGARRRALVRDRIGRAGRKAGEAIGTTARDLKNRSIGAAAEVRAAVRARQGREAAPDEVLAERVRSAIGRVVSHPGAITVTASEGRVTLGGRVLAEEVDRLLARAARVRGVAVLAGIRRGGPAGVVAGLVGLGLLGRAVTNLPGRLTGLDASRRAVDVQKTIELDAPPDRVGGSGATSRAFPGS